MCIRYNKKTLSTELENADQAALTLRSYQQVSSFLGIQYAMLEICTAVNFVFPSKTSNFRWKHNTINDFIVNQYNGDATLGLKFKCLDTELFRIRVFNDWSITNNYNLSSQLCSIIFLSVIHWTTAVYFN